MRLSAISCSTSLAPCGRCGQGFSGNFGALAVRGLWKLLTSRVLMTVGIDCTFQGSALKGLEGVFQLEEGYSAFGISGQ